MRNRAFFFGLMIALVPSAVQAQSATGSASGSAQSTVNAAASGDAQARINAAFEQATSVGVPASMLESKVAEGRAKGASMARIAAAVEHRLEVLTQAHSAIAARGEAASRAELAAAATALEAGARKEDVREVRESAKPEQRPAALTLLAEFVAEGRLPAQAVAGVQAAIAAQSSALLRLQSALQGGANASANGSAAARGGNAGVDLNGVAGVTVRRGGN